MIDATPLLRAYATQRLAALSRQDVATTQAVTLAMLLRRAARTRFGRDHDFARIDSVAAFQRAVPLRAYEAMWDGYWRAPFPMLRDVSWPGLMPAFALSSGTSAGRTKYIPVSRAMMRANRRAALDVLVHHVAAHPDGRVLAGRTFLLGGSTSLRRLAPGVVAGDLSGIAAARVPPWARSRTFPPPSIALLDDWETKLERLADAALREGETFTALTGTPSWLLLFLDRLAARAPSRPRSLAAFFPSLELLIHGGVGFASYRDRFATWLAGTRVALREVYPASEGFFASADRGPDEGLRAMVDNGLFYEFIPIAEIESAEPRRLWAASVEPGEDYALAVSSNAGLFAFLVGDVVRVLSRHPLRLMVVGRTGHYLSAFGEHLTGAEIEQAVLGAAAEQGVWIGEYTTAARVTGAHGQHVFVVEKLGIAPLDPDRLAASIDRALTDANEDYEAHRLGKQLLPPRVVAVPLGTFDLWMAARGKLGGQNKVPRVLTDPALLATLLSVAGQPHIASDDQTGGNGSHG